MTTIYALARLARTDARSLVSDIRDGEKIGKIMWRFRRARDEIAPLDLDGWPECGCTACGCSEPATTIDDASVPVCETCSEYTIDDNGDVHCMACGDVEMVTESCGAGNQMRSYARIIRP